MLELIGFLKLFSSGRSFQFLLVSSFCFPSCFIAMASEQWDFTMCIVLKVQQIAWWRFFFVIRILKNPSAFEEGIVLRIWMKASFKNLEYLRILSLIHCKISYLSWAFNETCVWECSSLHYSYTLIAVGVWSHFPCECHLVVHSLS